jgi:hypothetical protein
MQLEDIMLSEVSQAQKDKRWGKKDRKREW